MCDAIVVDVARGHASVFGEELDAGDLVIASGAESVVAKGDGLAAIAIMHRDDCVVKAALAFEKRVVRAKEAPELTWAGGKMHAHLDVEKDKLPALYVGRLEGTAPVAEHVHDTSWEIIFAVEAAGTFTLDGKPKRLAPRDVVMVPPKVKHSWAPDDGSKLVAIQMYTPPGPEQRFRALADAGPK
jgi:quercetin dioxygenase-like cupin family protein